MKKSLLLLLTALFITLGAQNVTFAEPVSYNTETQKVHKVSCKFAQKCTKNCIKIDRKDAYSKGGKPCKSCGG